MAHSLDMRALYYIMLPTGENDAPNRQFFIELVKANENCLNQNFTIISQKIAELNARLDFLESEE